MIREATKLWHDDVRPAPEGWRWAKTNAEAQSILRTFKVIECSLDHDLGAEGGSIVSRGHSPNGDGYDLVCWMIEEDYVPPKITIHSWNPDGAKRMARLLQAAGHNPVLAPFQLSAKQVAWLYQ